MLKKQRLAVIILGFVFAAGLNPGGLFAQNNVMDLYFNGNDLNNRINSYIRNVSSLIPDTTTLQNVWHIVPAGGFYLGAGMNANAAFFNRSMVGSFLEGSSAFGADNIDLAQFPDGVPFLPGAGFDVRAGFDQFDIGLTGTWLDKAILSEADVRLFGEGSDFTLQSFGIDIRYTLKLPVLTDVFPYFTFQLGYFYTGYNFGVTTKSSGKNESVKVNFRNDSYLLGVQVSKDLLFSMFTPYAGAKFIISKTDSDYEWYTNRPVLINGVPYLNGARYFSKSNNGDVEVYGQIYAGIGIYLINVATFTIGGAYTIGTNHFSITGSMRYMLGR